MSLARTAFKEDRRPDPHTQRASHSTSSSNSSLVIIRYLPSGTDIESLQWVGLDAGCDYRNLLQVGLCLRLFGRVCDRPHTAEIIPHNPGRETRLALPVQTSALERIHHTCASKCPSVSCRKSYLLIPKFMPARRLQILFRDSYPGSRVRGNIGSCPRAEWFRKGRTPCPRAKTMAARSSRTSRGRSRRT